jgi:hypothetical protein
MNGVTVYL